MSKKLTVLLLSVIILLAIPITPQATGALYSETFEGYTEDVPLLSQNSAWSYYRETTNEAGLSETVGNGYWQYRHTRVDGEMGSANDVIYVDFTPENCYEAALLADDYVLEWETDLLCNLHSGGAVHYTAVSLGNGDGVTYVQFGYGGNTDGSGVSHRYVLPDYSDKTKTYAINGENDYSLGSNTEFYTFRIELIIKKNGEFVNQYRLYIDDVPIGNRFDMKTPINEVNQTVSRIGFMATLSTIAYTRVRNILLIHKTPENLLTFFPSAKDKNDIAKAIAKISEYLPNYDEYAGLSMARKGMVCEYLFGIKNTFTDLAVLETALDEAIDITEVPKYSEDTVLYDANFTKYNQGDSLIEKSSAWSLYTENPAGSGLNEVMGNNYWQYQYTSKVGPYDAKSAIYTDFESIYAYDAALLRDDYVLEWETELLFTTHSGQATHYQIISLQQGGASDYKNGDVKFVQFAVGGRTTDGVTYRYIYPDYSKPESYAVDGGQDYTVGKNDYYKVKIELIIKKNGVFVNKAQMYIDGVKIGRNIDLQTPVSEINPIISQISYMATNSNMAYVRIKDSKITYKHIEPVYYPLTVSALDAERNNDEIIINGLFETGIDSAESNDVVAHTMLFEKNDHFYGGRFIRNNIESFNIGYRTMLEKPLVTDISGFTQEERGNLFAKVAAVYNPSENPSEMLPALMHCNNVFFNENIGVGNYDRVTEKSFSYACTSIPISDGVYERKVTLKINADEGSDVLIYILKKDMPISDISKIGTDDVLEYVNIQTANKNGVVVFDFLPSGGSGSYCFKAAIRNGTNVSYLSDNIEYIDLLSFQQIFEDLKTLSEDELLDGLMTNKNCFNFDRETVQGAINDGINVKKIAKMVLDKGYLIEEIDDYFSDFIKCINMFSSAKNAVNTDTIAASIENAKSYLGNYNAFKALNGKQQSQVCEYIFSIKSTIKDPDALDLAIKKGIDGLGSGTTSVSPGRNSSPTRLGYTSIDYNVVSPEAMSHKISTVTFIDIDGVEWAKEGIQLFAEKGYINGKAEGIFAPDDSVTKEEFVKILVSAFGLLDDNATMDFIDINESAWYYKYVASAVTHDIVHGYGNGEFGIGTYLSREDLCVIVYNLINKISPAAFEQGEYIEFTDEKEIAEYALDAVKLLAKGNIVNGIGNNLFMPKESCTRAQAVKILYEVYKALR